ncbi:autotransporter-associated beta strand repeat-containing protein [Akkermansiaceae bacterium]|nr:autotransporter-associated beta strand repeat-containing protein [Akkermansiaceae bacterium]
MPLRGVRKKGGGRDTPRGRSITFDLNGEDQELAGLQNTTAADRNQRISSATAATLTINNSAEYNFSNVTTGAEPGNGQITGAIALTKKGAGRFIMGTGAGNTYTGLTTIDGGALQVGHANALGGTAAGTVVNGSGTGTTVARLELDGGVTMNAGESLIINGGGNFSGALTSFSGTNKWQGPVTIGSTGTRIGASANATLEVSGVIDSGVVSTGLNIRTANVTDSTVILSGANTYLGDTNLVVGKLQIAGGNDRLPIGTRLNMTGSTLANATEFDLNGFNQEVAGLSLSTGSASFNSVNNSSSTASTLTVNTAAASPSSYGGKLAGNLALTKTGADTLTLTGTSNAYTGATDVSGGTLIVNGNITTSVQTTVASGATIGGSGSVGALTIQSGGFVAPGNSPGILNTGNYIQAGTYAAEISGLTAGTQHDQIITAGTVDITNGSLTTLFSGTYAVNDMVFLLLNDSTDAISGTYTGFAQGAVVSNYGGLDWQISYIADSAGSTFTGGNDIALMAVPEPNVAALLGGLGALLLLHRRR